MTIDVARAGCSYFGVRIPRHVRRDMADLAARGYTGVLHTFSENDLAYFRNTMAEIVAASHAAGLFVQASPWGLGRTFGGEAESRWVAFHPEECQVLDDGRPVAAACLNSAAYRDFCKEWSDWALDCGVDAVFWDEPAWVAPAHVGIDVQSLLRLCVAEDHAQRMQQDRRAFGIFKKEMQTQVGPRAVDRPLDCRTLQSANQSFKLPLCGTHWIVR